MVFLSDKYKPILQLLKTNKLKLLTTKIAICYHPFLYYLIKRPYNENKSKSPTRTSRHI